MSTRSGRRPRSAATPPRVLHVLAGAGVGGTERQLLLLLPTLARHVDTSLLIIRDGPLRPQFERSVPTVTVPKRGKIDPLFFVRLVRAVRANRPDAVQTWGTTANLWGSAAARLARVPRLVVTEGALDEWKGIAHRGADRVVYRWADALVCNSGRVAAFLRRYGASPQRTHVVANAIARAGAPSPARPAPPAPPLIVYLGRLHPVKGADVLVEALPTVFAAVPEARCVIAGPAAAPAEQDLAKRLRRRVEELALTEQIEFPGNLDDPWPLLERASVLVLPSRSEGSPNVVLEAMAAGVPVVAAAVGGVPELIEPGRTGTLVPPDDPGALAAAIVDALVDSDAAAERAGRARVGVAARHSLSVVTEAWLRVYADIGLVEAAG